MDLLQEMEQLRQLLAALQERERLSALLSKQTERSRKAIRAMVDKDLPKSMAAPHKPKSPVHAPVAPEKPRLVVMQDTIKNEKPSGFWFSRKKREREQREQQELVERTNRKLIEEYNRDYANYLEREKEHKRQVENYEREMIQYTAALEQYKNSSAHSKEAKEQKREENRKQYAAQIAQEEAKVTEMEQELTQLHALIEAASVVAASDKNIPLVRFVLDKLETRRADSVMMALNQYDAERKQAQDFETKMKIDAMNIRFEAEQRRWERQVDSQRQTDAWLRDLEKQNLARESLKEQKRTNDELERIRRAAERNR